MCRFWLLMFAAFVLVVDSNSENACFQKYDDKYGFGFTTRDNCTKGEIVLRWKTSETLIFNFNSAVAVPNATFSMFVGRCELVLTSRMDDNKTAALELKGTVQYRTFLNFAENAELLVTQETREDVCPGSKVSTKLDKDYSLTKISFDLLNHDIYFFLTVNLINKSRKIYVYELPTNTPPPFTQEQAITQLPSPIWERLDKLVVNATSSVGLPVGFVIGALSLLNVV